MSQIEVARAADVKENQALAVTAAGTPLLLTRVNGTVHAVSSKCPHMGLSLAKGKVVDGSITCPFHGSRFDVCSGASLDWCNAVMGMPVPGWTSRLIAMGKQPRALPVFAASEQDGKVFVRVPG